MSCAKLRQLMHPSSPYFSSLPAPRTNGKFRMRLDGERRRARTSSGGGDATWPQKCTECHPTFVDAPSDCNPIARLTPVNCICSRSRLRRRVCWLKKMQAGAMTGAMTGLFMGTFTEGWVLTALGNDSMSCYDCMCKNTLTTPNACCLSLFCPLLQRRSARGGSFPLRMSCVCVCMRVCVCMCACMCACACVRARASCVSLPVCT